MKLTNNEKMVCNAQGKPLPTLDNLDILSRSVNIQYTTDAPYHYFLVVDKEGNPYQGVWAEQMLLEWCTLYDFLRPNLKQTIALFLRKKKLQVMSDLAEAQGGK